MGLKYFISSFFLILLSFSPIKANEITFLTHEIKPFTYEKNGVLKGFAIDIVSEMMKLNNSHIKFRKYPFKRALATVQQKDNYALFIVAQRPERLDTVKWVGPLISSGVYFYKKKGSLLNINTLEDAKKVDDIGVALGNADYFFLKKEGFKNLSETATQVQSIQKLYLNRINLTPISEIVMLEIVNHIGLDPKLIKRTNFKLYDSVLYLVFSKNIPDNVIEKWQNSLYELQQTGKYQEIYDKYIK